MRGQAGAPDGSPEATREPVAAASKAMKMGDWKSCHGFIINEMNGKQCLRLPSAWRRRHTFGLGLPTAHSIISKIIFNEELVASLDQPTQTVQGTYGGYFRDQKDGYRRNEGYMRPPAAVSTACELSTVSAPRPPALKS
ncbi:hypothetical protein P7K49_018775 [Saguinus oedipus]|uniref:Uncharacterized protein n=1 Tax=Saguinus oedipus TaxID=9490 RepID=A0ABQ9V7K0_SAGOE|nr:hypothetical protein P7K49_018775 [Saguinus oedipus]